MEQYREMYRRSLDGLEGFWDTCAGELEWYRGWDKVLGYDLERVRIDWTNHYSLRRGRVSTSKAHADRTLEGCPEVESFIVVRRIDQGVEMVEGRDPYWDELMARDDLPPNCEPEVMDSDNPLFILYTSGSTGKP